MLACCRRWVSDSSVCQEIVLSTLPTHFGPRGRCLQCLGLLEQLFLRQVLSWLLLTLEYRLLSGRLLTSYRPFLNLDITASKQQLAHLLIRQVKPSRDRINQLVTRQ